MISFIGNCHFRCLDRDIAANRFPHHFCSVFGLNPHGRDADLIFLIILFRQDHTLNLNMIRFKPFLLFQRQIRPNIILFNHSPLPFLYFLFYSLSFSQKIGIMY